MTAPLLKRGLEPLAIASGARTLILGSFPGDVSLRERKYYAHPQNQFWRIVSAIYGEPVSDDYGAKVSLLRRNNVVVWDVLHSAERIGSSDSAIRNAIPNKFEAFFDDHQHIRAIAFNGQKAHAMFHKCVVPSLLAQRHIRAAVLPSTSPAYTLSFEKKVAVWRAFLNSGQLSVASPSAED